MKKSPQVAAAPTPACSDVGAATHTLLLQRQCACGGAPDVTGECADCRRQRLLTPSRLPLQTKLAVSQSGDRLEQEAEQVTDWVMRTPAPTLALSTTANPAAQQPLTHPRLALQRQSMANPVAIQTPPLVQATLQKPGQPLDATTRAFIEPRLRYDFSQVKVHHDQAAAASAQSVNAHAYTVGEHIVFGAGQYVPQTDAGRRLLVHELTHVIQQNGHTGGYPLMRQACSHDGRAANCGGGALARWRLVNTVTQAVTDLALDDLIVNSGVRRHFGGAWATQVQTPPNPEKSGRDRGRVDGMKVVIGGELGVEVVEVKSRATQFGGGCRLATREANGYVRVLNRIAPQVAAISQALQGQGGLRVAGGQLNAEQRGVLQTAGVDLGDPQTLLAWRFYNSLQNRLNMTFTTGFSRMTADVNRDGTPGQDYDAGPSILVPCRTRRGRRGVKQRRLLFQVNGAGGVSYGCRDTGCQEEQEQEEEQRQVEQVARPVEERQPDEVTEPRQRAPTIDPPIDQPIDQPGDQPEQQPGDDLTVPVLVGAGGAALTAAAVAAARRRAAAVAAQRAAAELARQAAARQAAQAAWRRAAEAAAQRRAAQAAARGAGRRSVGRAAGRAVIYAEVAAAVFLLASGRAEARPGPGQSALEAFYHTMTQSGAPPSPALRELIESDPLLRQLAEEAATSGNAGPLQEAATRRMLELVRDHPEEFSPADLEILLQTANATAATSSNGPQNVEELRAAIAHARAVQRGEAVTTGGGPGTGGQGAGAAARPATPDTQPGAAGAHDVTSDRGLQERFPNLSAETRQELSQAPAQVRRLFTAMTTRGGRGPRVSNEAVRRFLQIVPANLTEAQVAQLVAQLRPAETDALDAILGSLQAAIQRVQAGAAQPEQAAGDADAVQDEAAATPGAAGSAAAGVPLDEYARAVVAHINTFRGWDGIAVNEARFQVANEEQDFTHARLNQEILPLVVSIKVAADNGFVRIAGFGQGVVTSRTQTVVNLELRSAIVFVNEHGQTVATMPAGRRIANNRLIR